MPLGMGAEGAEIGLGLGCVYIFNLIVGTGALALPKAFHDSGYILGPIMLSISAAVSFVGATFVVEAMAVANVVLERNGQRRKGRKESSSSTSSRESIAAESLPLISVPLERRVELSEAGSLLWGRWGFAFVQLCLIVYLLGDLAIYSTVVPKSLMQVICQNLGNSCLPGNASVPLSDADNCFESVNLSRLDFYRILVAVFVGSVGPFVFLGITKTKYLQLFTTVTRWSAFTLLFVLALRLLLKRGAEGHPPPANFAGFSDLFGVATYAFMCHHSLPSLVTPIRPKARLFLAMAAVYVAILLFYCLLSLSGVFAFATLEDVYTLNFLLPCRRRRPVGWEWALAASDYFLALFPVFALSTNFPIVGITLRNNVLALLAAIPSVHDSYSRLSPSREPLDESLEESSREAEAEMERENESTSRSGARVGGMISSGWLWWLAAGGVVVLPSLISVATDDVEELAAYTGAYAGVGVQFLVPSVLALGARRVVGGREAAEVQSPFRSGVWPWLLIAWAALTLILVSLNFALKASTK